MKKLVILLVVFFVLPVLAQEGNEAPDFQLDKLGGGTFKLSDHADKVIYINWFGWGCSTCRAEGESTQKQIADEHSGENFKAIGIDVWDGSSSNVQDFKLRTNINYDLLLKGGSTADAYGATYQYSMVIDQEGIIRWYGRSNQTSSINNTISALLMATSIEEPAVAYSFELKENYPNPFNPTTRIPFTVDKVRSVKLAVYDARGAQVRTIINAKFGAGSYEASWDGRNDSGRLVSSGIYFLRLQSDNLVKTNRIVLLK